MQWCWFKQSLAYGDKFEFVFNDGDMYVMSEKAVGSDWKRRNIWTLRHSAGSDKYLKEKRQIAKLVKNKQKKIEEDLKNKSFLYSYRTTR